MLTTPESNGAGSGNRAPKFMVETRRIESYDHKVDPGKPLLQMLNRNRPGYRFHSWNWELQTTIAMTKVIVVAVFERVEDEKRYPVNGHLRKISEMTAEVIVGEKMEPFVESAKNARRSNPKYEDTTALTIANYLATNACLLDFKVLEGMVEFAKFAKRDPEAALSRLERDLE